MNNPPSLYKRLPESDPDYRQAPWYASIHVAGKRFRPCLETADHDEAARRARLRQTQYQRAHDTDTWSDLDATRLRARPSSTLGQLLATYETSPLEASDTTRTHNANCLKNLLRRATGHPEPDIIPLRELTPEVVQAFYASTPAATDQLAAARARRTANSIANQAGAVFAPRALAAYHAANLTLPDLAPFTRALRDHRYRRVPRKDYTPPADTLITKTLADWAATDDRDLFLTVGLELAFGLRAGEIAQARWSWLTTIDGQPAISAAAAVKNHTGQIQVRALDPWYTTWIQRIDARQWRSPKPEDFLIPGSTTHRTDDNFRRVSDWMRHLGWTTTKTNHAFRDYAGSQIAMKYGIWAASVWLRHAGVGVTQAHYTTYVTAHRVASPDTLPVHWATNGHATAAVPSVP